MREQLVALCLAVAPIAAQAQQPVRLTLSDAVTRAACDVAAVDLAELQQQETLAQVRQARAGLLPGLSLGAGWLNRSFNRRSLGFDFPVTPGMPAPPDLIGPFDNVDVRLRATQALLDPASLARVRAARSRVRAVRAQSDVVRDAGAQVAALSYLRAARAKVALAARRADSALAAELVTLAEAQLEVGIATVLDVTRARTQLVESRQGVIVEAGRLRRSEIELARAVGLPASAPVVVVDSLTVDAAAAGLPGSRAEALARAMSRPDLRAEGARRDAAERASAAIAAERAPRVELVADWGLNGPTAASAIATRQIAVQVTVPIFDGLRREGRLDEQRAVARAAEVRRSELEREVEAGVEVALIEVEVAEARQVIAAERWRLAGDELDQARERFAAGTAGNIELITAQVALLRARDADIDARFTAAAARVALASAVGDARAVR